uniref:Uncharacterized protein n=1 Tax=Pipistrellus kuhlii TaxID=59472 RepID=A0A7J7VV32_PIPKU|nr:hypothetical protein mPipKuh1_008240 [Pipistrellus kuhlii]
MRRKKKGVPLCNMSVSLSFQPFHCVSSLHSSEIIVFSKPAFLCSVCHWGSCGQGLVCGNGGQFGSPRPAAAGTELPSLPPWPPAGSSQRQGFRAAGIYIGKEAGEGWSIQKSISTPAADSCAWDKQPLGGRGTGTAIPL